MNQFKEFVSQISTKILCYSRLANNKSHQTFMFDEERGAKHIVNKFI